MALSIRDRLAARRSPGWRGRALVPAAAAWLLLSCNATGQGVDLAPPSPDLTVVHDLSTGPSCGTLVICLLQCGIGQFACSAKCTAGASAAESMKAGALALCAATHCVSADGGTGGLPSILGCLLTSCQSEVLACDGLPL